MKKQIEFEANAESLKQYQIPEWFRDAKFGIFIHYGIYAVPAFGDEWYGHWMYKKDSKSWGGDDINAYHKNTYGGIEKVGYKDFITEFCEGLKKFQDNNMAEKWVDLFEKAGAKYVMPVGIHHDSFALYHSDIQKTFNSVRSCGVDYAGLLQKAVKAKKMHYGISNHFAENKWFFDKEDGKGTDIYNEKYNELYGAYNTVEEHVEKWYKISMEIIEKYEPELIYYDFDLKNEEYMDVKRKMLSEYYNMAQQWEGNEGVICNYKYEAFEDGEAVLEVERGSLADIRKEAWQTCTSIGAKSWGYIKNEVYRSAKEMLNALIDIVSKNGNLLLNIGPKADGTIPKEAETVLLEIGKWLEVNGEAIYKTRPWEIYGEGPNSKKAEGAFCDDFNYSCEDIRFTTSKDGKAIYAIIMDTPVDDQIKIASLFENVDEIKNIQLLCNGKEVKWNVENDKVNVWIPDTNILSGPITLKINLK